MIKVDIVNEVSKIADILRPPRWQSTRSRRDAASCNAASVSSCVIWRLPGEAASAASAANLAPARKCVSPGRTIRFKPGKDLQNIGYLDPTPFVVWQPAKVPRPSGCTFCCSP